MAQIHQNGRLVKGQYKPICRDGTPCTFQLLYFGPCFCWTFDFFRKESVPQKRTKSIPNNQLPPATLIGRSLPISSLVWLDMVRDRKNRHVTRCFWGIFSWPPRKLTYPTWGKEKSSSKVPWEGIYEFPGEASSTNHLGCIKPCKRFTEEKR